MDASHFTLLQWVVLLYYVIPVLDYRLSEDDDLGLSP